MMMMMMVVVVVMVVVVIAVKANRLRRALRSTPLSTAAATSVLASRRPTATPNSFRGSYGCFRRGRFCKLLLCLLQLLLLLLLKAAWALKAHLLVPLLMLFDAISVVFKRNTHARRCFC